MSQIFKYYPPTSYSLDALVHEHFWFAKHSILNDPFDLNSKIFDAFPGFKKLLEERGYNIGEYEKTLDNFALCSFTIRNH